MIRKSIRLADCPLCDGRVKRRRGKIELSRSGRRALVVPDVSYESCVDCGEKFFDPAAMSVIERARASHRRGRLTHAA